MLLVAIVFAAISADTILPFTILAETTEFAASWSAPTASSAIFACVTASSTIEAVTTALEASWSAPTASSAINACVIESFGKTGI